MCKGTISHTMNDCYPSPPNNIIISTFTSYNISSITNMFCSISGSSSSLSSSFLLPNYIFLIFNFLNLHLDPPGTSPLSLSFSFIFFSRYGMFSYNKYPNIKGALYLCCNQIFQQFTVHNHNKTHSLLSSGNTMNIAM